MGSGQRDGQRGREHRRPSRGHSRPSSPVATDRRTRTETWRTRPVTDLSHPELTANCPQSIPGSQEPLPWYQGSASLLQSPLRPERLPQPAFTTRQRRPSSRHLRRRLSLAIGGQRAGPLAPGAGGSRETAPDAAAEMEWARTGSRPTPRRRRRPDDTMRAVSKAAAEPAGQRRAQ